MTKPSSNPAKAAILYLIIGALGVWAIYLQREVTSLRASTDKAEDGTAARDALNRENRKLRERVAELESKPAAPEPIPAPSAAPAPANAKSSLAALASQMLNTPAMRDMMAQTARRSLETRYAPLFARLNLSPEQRSQLLDLLVEQQNGSMDAAMKMMSGDLSAEARKQATEEMKESREAAVGKIRDFLGEPGYAEYQDFSRQAAEQTRTTTLAATFARSGEPLSPEQSDAMTSLIAEEQKNFHFTQDMNAPDVDPSVALNKDAVDRYFRETEQLQSQIAQRAAAVLTPTQLETYRKSQASQNQLMRTSMDMARQMMGGK